MEIKVIGGTGRLAACERALSADGRSSLYTRAVLLPVPTSRDGIHVTGTATRFDEVAEMGGAGSLTVGYAIPRELAELILKGGGELLDLSEDEGFLRANAGLTARGALGWILTDGVTDIADMSVGIIGYGRIGAELLRLLLFVGARVVLFTGRREVALEMASVGVECRTYDEMGDLSCLDLIVNTAPAPILGRESDLPPVRILDLASGNNLPPSPLVVKLSSVPDAMYPVSAGRLYAEYVSRKVFVGEGEE